jgi:hypothetical protein
VGHVTPTCPGWRMGEVETLGRKPCVNRRIFVWLNDGFWESQAMNSFNLKRVAAGTVSQAWAHMQDYEFKLVRSEVKQGDAIIAVRRSTKRRRRPSAMPLSLQPGSIWPRIACRKW